MVTKNELFGQISDLSFNQKIKLSKSNLLRVIHLYELFDNMVETENLEKLSDEYSYHSLHEIVTKINEYSNQEAISKIEICEALIPDYDDYGGILTSIAISCASSVAEILDFISTQDTEHIQNSIDEILEINQFIEMERYLENGITENLDDYLKKHKIKELLIQQELIVRVKNNDDYQLNNLISESKFEYYYHS